MYECLTLLVMMFGGGDYVCVEYLNYPVPKMDLDNIRLHVTSYWIYGEDGNRLHSFGGQCDRDCSVTAYGWQTEARAEEYLAGPHIAACPYEWGGFNIYFVEHRTYACWDRFGNPWYDASPFYHHIHGWVIAIDLMQPEGQFLIEPEDWTLHEWGVTVWYYTGRPAVEKHKRGVNRDAEFKTSVTTYFPGGKVKQTNISNLRSGGDRIKRAKSLFPNYETFPRTWNQAGRGEIRAGSTTKPHVGGQDRIREVRC